MPLFPANGFQVPTVTKNKLDDSDYILVVDANGILCKITKADLSTELSSSGGSSNSSISRSYVGNGDTNGVFYYLGTVNNIWSNPSLINAIELSSSSIFDQYGYGTIANLAGRNPASFATDNNPGSSVLIDLKDNRLRCTRYTLQAQNDGSSNPRNWTLTASNDLDNWILLDTAIDQINFNSNAYYLSPILVPPIAGFRYFKFTQSSQSSSGNNYFILNEIEFYGDLSG